MDPLASKYTVWKRILHKFQARRDIPFRKRFFVGYDLHGNTYWEFSPDGNMQRLRRKMEPYQEYVFQADYFSTVPPQWLQWLRRTRPQPPTLDELLADKFRQENLKSLSRQADEKWQQEKLIQQREQDLKLQSELDKVKSEKNAKEELIKVGVNSQDENQHLKTQEQLESNKTAYDKDPWAEAKKAQGKDYNPIQSAKIPLRQK